MATQVENSYIDLVEPTGVKQVHSREITLYIVSIVAFITTLIVLAMVVRDTPDSNFDTRFSREIRGWESPVAKLLFESVSEVTSLVESIVIGLITVALLAIGGRHRLAFGVFFAGMFIGAVSLIADYSLGQFVGRDRPISGSQSFPSGHVFGTIAFYGFAIYLALRYRLRRRLLIPLLIVSFVLFSVTGLARLHLRAHWPSDIVGGYLLGFAVFLALIRFHRWFEGIRWFSPPQLGRNMRATALPGMGVTDSHTFVATMGPNVAATMECGPPPLIRMMYWIAFKAEFPGAVNSRRSGREKRRSGHGHAVSSPTGLKHGGCDRQPRPPDCRSCRSHSGHDGWAI